MSRPFLSRRSFLLGAANTFISLPILEAMFTSDLALAQATGARKRFAFFFFPNGTINYEMSPTNINNFSSILASLAPYRNHLVPINGLTNRDNNTWERNGVNLGSGSPHEFNATTFLTCRRLGSISELRVGTSIDQIIGAHLQQQDGTNLGSLVIGDGHQRSGTGQGGVNSTYHNLISWKSETDYVVPISNTVVAFQNIFAGVGNGNTQTPDPKLLTLLQQKKSILDSTLEQTEAMKKRLGSSDRQSIERYLSSVREVEVKVSTALDGSAQDNPPACTIPASPTNFNPLDRNSFADYTRTMMDLIALGFQCQSTSVAVYQMSIGNGGARSGVGGVNSDQHSVSHFRSAGTEAEHRRVNEWYVSQYAYFLQRMTALTELEQPLIRNVVSLFGSGIGDSDRHDGGNCPIIMAGGQNHGVVTNRVLDFGLRQKQYGEGTPLANLHLGLAKLAGVELDSFGNSNGAIDLKVS